MSAIDTDRFRERLLEERKRVEAAIQYLREEHPGSLEEEIEESTGASDNHPADVATATDREIDCTLEEQFRAGCSRRSTTTPANRRRGRSGDLAGRAARQLPRSGSKRCRATQCIDCKRKAERG